MNFSSLVIAGGGLTVLSVTGGIKYFEEQKVKTLKNLVGTSAGAIMCLFVALNYRSYEIVRFLEEVLRDDAIVQFNINDVFNIFTEYGLSKGENVVRFLERMIQKKLKQSDITFLELAKLSGMNLVVCVTNLTDEREEYFNVDTSPEMSVVTAIRMSCSIPFMFAPVKYKNKLYVDGALYSNFPMTYFADHSLGDILGICLGNDFAPPSDFISYALYIIFTLVKKINKKNLIPNGRIIRLNIPNIPWFSLMHMRITVTPEQIQEYVDHGYKLIKEHLEQT